MRIGEKEEAIIDGIISFQEKYGETGSFRLSDVASWIYPEGTKALKNRPKHWRKALAVTMRVLGAKLELRGYGIKRVSRLGRGQEALYSIRGDFSKLLKDRTQ